MFIGGSTISIFALRATSSSYREIGQPMLSSSSSCVDDFGAHVYADLLRGDLAECRTLEKLCACHFSFHRDEPLNPLAISHSLFLALHHLVAPRWHVAYQRFKG
jgi:hypothetical protein